MTLPHPVDTQSCHHERDRLTLLNRSIEMAAFLTVGITNFHYSKEGWNRSYYIQFQGAQQAHNKETLYNPKNKYRTAGARRLHICDSP